MRRRFLLAGHLDGQAEALAKLRTCVQQRGPDGVLFAGGLLGGDTAGPAHRLKQWEGALEGLGRLGVVTAVIPGDADVPLREFLRLARAAIKEKGKRKK